MMDVIEDVKNEFKENAVLIKKVNGKYYSPIDFCFENKISELFRKIPKWKKSERHSGKVKNGKNRNVRDYIVLIFNNASLWRFFI